jgi:hypothetical protein
MGRTPGEIAARAGIGRTTAHHAVRIIWSTACLLRPRFATTSFRHSVTVKGLSTPPLGQPEA